MSAFADLVIKDDLAGTDRTFVPAIIDSNGVAHYYEVADVFDARRHVSVGLRLPNAGSKVVRIQYKVVIPVMNSDVPAQKDGEVIANCEFVVPKIASSANRTNIQYFMHHLLKHAVANDGVQSLNGVY
jgi:ribosomal protein S16